MKPLTPEELLALINNNTEDDISPDFGMGDSLKSRSELPPPYAPANPPTYDRPEGMAESLHARAELSDPQTTPVARRNRVPASIQKIIQPAKSDVPFVDKTYNSLDRLADAQEAARLNNLNVNLLNAGQGLNEALNHRKFDRTVNENLAKTANQPVEFYKEHEAAQKSDLDVLNTLYKQSTAQHLRDPNSDISKATRQMFAKMGIALDPGTSAMDVEQSDNLARLVGIKENADSRRDAARERNADRQDRLNDKEEARTEKQIEGLSKRLDSSGLSELDSVIGNIQQNINLSGHEDIPGAGLTGSLPDFMVSRKGQDVRQAVQGLHNILLKARSGGAVTPQEAERYRDELGFGTSKKNDEQLRQGIKNTINFLASKKRGIIAGYRPDAVQKYGSRGGNINIPSYDTGNSTVQVQLSNGEIVSGPKENLKALLQRDPGAKVLN